jgi:predicted DNA-binding transcriptional regulator AlpA
MQSNPIPNALALRPREASKALGISERTLWSITTPRGDLPCVRIGTAVVYPVDSLRTWLEARANGKGGNHEEA